MDSQLLRASHWDFGDNHETANEHYATTYGLTMQPKKRILNGPIPNRTFKTSFSITGHTLIRIQQKPGLIIYQ